MEPRGSSVSPLRMRRRITTSAPEQDHSRSGASIGRAECREKKIGIEPKGSFFFLTFPLIGHVTCMHEYALLRSAGVFGTHGTRRLPRLSVFRTGPCRCRD